MATRETKTMAPAENPIDDVLYDWIAALHAKAKAVDMLDQYIADARAEDAKECVALFEKLRAQDVVALAEIKEHVAAMFTKQVAAKAAPTRSKDGKGTRGADVAHRSSFTPTH